MIIVHLKYIDEWSKNPSSHNIRRDWSCPSWGRSIIHCKECVLVLHSTRETRWAGSTFEPMGRNRTPWASGGPPWAHVYQTEIFGRTRDDSLLTIARWFAPKGRFSSSQTSQHYETNPFWWNLQVSCSSIISRTRLKDSNGVSMLTCDMRRLTSLIKPYCCWFFQMEGG